MSVYFSKWIAVWIIVCAFVPGISSAQEFTITGADFESGKADTKLAEIARQVGASGKIAIVTTPSYWQAQVTHKLRVGAPDMRIETDDGFSENVRIRIVDVNKTAKPEARNHKAPAPQTPVAVQ